MNVAWLCVIFFIASSFWMIEAFKDKVYGISFVMMCGILCSLFIFIKEVFSRIT